MAAAEAPVAALLPQVVEVLAVRRETEDVVTLTLTPPPGFRAQPGQFNMLYAFGVGEAPISLSGDAADPARLVHTIREVGAVTKALGALQPGDQLGVRGPFGSSWPLGAAAGRDLVIAAGGLGLAPLRPAIYAALAERERFRRLVLLSGTRTAADRLFVDELEGWQASGLVEVQQTVDSADPEWHSHVGLITTLLPVLGLLSPDSVAFLCGPEIMMRFTANALIDRGLAPGSVFVSLERNMKCAVATCGHCQLAGSFVCKDGPVYAYPEVSQLILVREL